ncbi:MAG: 7,8-dihydroneopterin aldolase/epimerase/oxygenase [Verrucomicrobiota bacterium]
MSMDESNCVRIQKLEVQAQIGVPAEERISPQRLTFNLTLWPLRAFEALQDDIERAVNYATVCEEAKKFVGERRDRLIETLADALARHLLEKFEVRKITIELRKYVLPETEFVSVTVTRDRSA